MNRETKQKSLEEIAAAFGDKVVLLTERDLEAEEKAGGNAMRTEHLEMSGKESV